MRSFCDSFRFGAPVEDFRAKNWSAFDDLVVFYYEPRTEVRGGYLVESRFH